MQLYILALMEHAKYIDAHPQKKKKNIKISLHLILSRLEFYELYI